MDTLFLWMNLGVAWVCVALSIYLSVIYIIRLVARHDNSHTQAIKRLNRKMRLYHKEIGITLVAFGFVHGLYSSQTVWSFNIGTVSWIASILLGVNWMFRKKLSKFKGWMFYHRVLTVLFLGLIVWHVIDVGGIQAPRMLFGIGETTRIEMRATDDGSQSSTATSQSASPAATKASSDTTARQGAAAPQETPLATPAAAATTTASAQLFAGNAVLKDGTYSGEAQGYRPGLTVSVVVKDGAVASIEVTGHNEVNKRFYSRPISIVPQEIIDSQTTDVDTVTGSTCTSAGIINAVNNALSKALVSGSLPQDLSLPRRR
jgi:uncharacterized protein with FMN-binding domain